MHQGFLLSLWDFSLKSTVEVCGLCVAAWLCSPHTRLPSHQQNPGSLRPAQIRNPETWTLDSVASGIESQD